MHASRFLFRPLPFLLPLRKAAMPLKGKEQVLRALAFPLTIIQCWCLSVNKQLSASTHNFPVIEGSLLMNDEFKSSWQGTGEDEYLWNGSFVYSLTHSSKCLNKSAPLLSPNIHNMHHCLLLQFPASFPWFILFWKFSRKHSFVCLSQLVKYDIPGFQGAWRQTQARGCLNWTRG